LKLFIKLNLFCQLLFHVYPAVVVTLFLQLTLVPLQSPSNFVDSSHLHEVIAVIKRLGNVNFYKEFLQYFTYFNYISYLHHVVLFIYCFGNHVSFI